MLDYWIIEEIRRRDEERRRAGKSAVLEIPVGSPPRDQEPDEKEESGRGVVVVDYSI